MVQLCKQKKKIFQLINSYVIRFSEEAKRIALIEKFVTQHQGSALFDRKNFSGHITASAFIINKKADKLLLLKHKFLNRWLQPGGHVDITDESLEQAARREAEEETGLPADSLHLAFEGVFDFDSHWIPENITKQELPHYHHDVRFLFQTNTDQITLDANESTDAKWLSLEELKADEDFALLVEKIKSSRFKISFSNLNL